MVSYSEKKLKGIGVSKGVSIGPVILFDEGTPVVRPRTLLPAQVENEIARFDLAIIQSREAIQRVREKALKQTTTGDAEIFEVHISLLSDPMLVDKTRETIRSERLNADYALLQTLQEYQKFFSELPPNLPAYNLNCLFSDFDKDFTNKKRESVFSIDIVKIYS